LIQQLLRDHLWPKADFENVGFGCVLAVFRSAKQSDRSGRAVCVIDLIEPHLDLFSYEPDCVTTALLPETTA
jgi:hypothetical protein